MTQADVSELERTIVSKRTTRDIQEREAPFIRLKNDADLEKIYQFGRKLGQGSFGVVYEATHIETQTKWAIKEVCRPAAGSWKVKQLEQEINILKQVSHVHIIHLQEVYETAKMTYLVTELCAGGELKHLLQRKKFFTEDETRHIIRSLAAAVAYLHKRANFVNKAPQPCLLEERYTDHCDGIMHRDLKLENILVKNSLDEDDNGRINIKVTDFGLSVQTDGVGIGNMMTEVCGTLIYMAPEMMSDRGYRHWCDVWSVGVIMYMLLCGESPFISKTKTSLLQEIKNKEVEFTQAIWATVSDAAKNILTCLLKVDPAYRMSPDQLLQNPWITGATNAGAVLPNILELMHDHMEQDKGAQTMENSSPTSSEDTVDPFLVSGAASTETDNNCNNHAKLSPGKESSGRALATTTKPTKESDGSKRKNSSETPGPSHPTTTQSHGSMKPSTQLCSKLRRARDKKDLGTGRKPSSDLSKTDHHRPSTSRKSKTCSC